MRSKLSLHPPTWRKLFFFCAALLFLFLAVSVILVRSHPGIGAIGADKLRNILGDEIVARMEAVLFKIDDSLMSLEYRTGLAKANPPWQLTPTYSPWPSPMAAVSSAIPTTTAPPQLPLTGGFQAGSAQSAQSSPTPMPGATPTPLPSLSLPSLAPLGNLPGEGVWTPYIQNTAGQVLTEKTFFQPDPRRPYAQVAVVAFDLRATRLHFVIGFEEPYARSNPPVRSSGAIPAQDRTPGALLAAFNGGFKYRQGHFGAMANGLVSAPPQPGLATVAITPQGQIILGAWGTDLSPQQAFIAYRQNGPLALSAGKVTPQVANTSYWGATISGDTVTWRTGLGISQDGNTLYYFAGPYLNITTLTRVMSAVGVWNAMQLDINNYWVAFYTYRSQGNELVPEPLFAKDMAENPGRFLQPYARDFFYITTR